MVNIFLSYRRSDSRIHTERIHDHLSSEFGVDHVFLDVDGDSIRGGDDWQQVLEQELIQSDVVVVVVGKTWEDEIQKRADDVDYVRFEIETALAEGKKVIPVLVDGASMPARQSLPESIRALRNKQYQHVRPNPDFRGDMQRLIKVIKNPRDTNEVSITDTSKGKNKPAPRPVLPIVAAVLALSVIGIGGYFLLGILGTGSSVVDPTMCTNPGVFTATEPGIVYQRRVYDYKDDTPDNHDLYVAYPDENGTWVSSPFLEGEEAAIFPRVSPDGTQIVFLSNRDNLPDKPDWNLWMMDIGGCEPPVQLTDLDPNASTNEYEWGWLDWSPDSDRLIFGRWDGDSYELYQMIVSNPGTLGEQLTQTDSSSHPAWSPETGRFIAYTRRDVEGEPRAIWIYDRETQQHQQVTFPPETPPAAEGENEPELIEDTVPQWSADERTLVFQRTRDIYRIEIDANGEVVCDEPQTDCAVLLAESGTNWSPAVSPDGTQVAYYDGGIDSIRIMDVIEGDKLIHGEITDLTTEGDFMNTNPAWIPVQARD